MQTLAIIFFSIAALLSAWLMPNNLYLLQLTVVSMARALALVLALVFWVACGRLDSWGSSRVLVGLGTIVGALALAAGCLFVQITRDDNVPVLWAWVFRLTAALLPICFLAAVFLRSGKMFVIVSLLAPVAGILVSGSWKSLNAEYNANTPEAKDIRRREALSAARMAEVDRIPDGAGPESFLEFIKPNEDWGALKKAQARIEMTPDWVARLSAMLDGEKRLSVLYVLTRKMDSLPNDVAERCWSTAESIALEQTELLKKGNVPTKADEELLNDSVYQMGQSEAARDQHWKTLAAVSDFLYTARANLNTATLDGWVHCARLRFITDDEGIVPLLDIVGPDAYEVREAALARIAKVPDSTAKLAELLDGPHRLGALVALAKRAGELPPDLFERCWRTAGVMAREMAADFKQGKGPTRIDVCKLSSSVKLLWDKLGADKKEGHLADLAVVRDVVGADGSDWDKFEFSWADKELAGSAAQAGGKGK
jgi:hypothetical protein